MKLAYLINQYPKASHTFVRREIEALEALGNSVERFSIRECDEELVDPADHGERARTHVLLADGAGGLAAASLQLLLTRPHRFIGALWMALRLGRRSDRGIVRHLAYLAEACALTLALKDRPVEHLHAHFGTNSTTVALLCRELGGPGYSFTVHGPEEFDKPEAIGLREKILRARFVVAVSHFGRSQLCRWCPHDQWHKLHVVHCGVDRGFLGTPAAVPDIARFVCVGRYCEQKGQQLLLEAAALLARDQHEFQLVFVGDGELRNELEQLARSLNIADRVRLTGWKSGEEVREELLAGRVMVLPSFAEGLPVVIMEALALGRPVISTYVAGIPELVVPGDCGWLVPAGAVKPLADAMRTALQTSAERLTAMGNAGARRVAESHDSAREAAKLNVLFRSDRPQAAPTP